MNVKREHGSALTTIIIIGIVIALLCAAGYVFLSKLGVVPTFGINTQNGQAKNAHVDKRPVATFDKSFGVALSFRYPKTWSIDKKHEGAFPVKTDETSIETYTLVSPNKSYSVVYKLAAGNTGRGTMCSMEGVSTVASVDTENVAGWKGAELVHAITKTSENAYTTAVGLVAPVTMMKVKKGSNPCLFTVGALSVPSMFLTLNLLDASVHLGDMTKFPESEAKKVAKTEAEAHQLYSGPTFDEAKAILLSTTLK